MKYNFDEVLDRRHSNSTKWMGCPDDVIAMTIADIDFAIPEPIQNALKKRLEHPALGYERIADAAMPYVAGFYERTFNCKAAPDWIVYALGVMPGVYLACYKTGGRAMYCTPIYPHIRRIGNVTGCPSVEVPMKLSDGKYYMDIEAMEKAYDPSVKCFVLCNPHNPVGRVYTKEELLEVVDFCERHDLVLISDEIHCEFAFDRQHTPIFTLCEGRKVKTMTFASPGKTCNVPKCQFAYAIIPDADLRKEYKSGLYSLFAQGNILDGIAFTEAYSGSCDDWKMQLKEYLKENRDYFDMRLKNMPHISATHNEGTFLAWIDCSELGLENPSAYLLENAKLKLGTGADFGAGYEKFVRMNFACPRVMLKEALDRLENCMNLYK